MPQPATRDEVALLAAAALLLAGSLLAPAVVQPASYHAFADARTLWGIPRAMDVLSNLPFALAGLAGLFVLRRAWPGLDAIARRGAALFFAGLLLTACASAYYHWAPDDVRLAIDRVAMSVAFAVLLGLAAADAVSPRAGAGLAAALLLVAPGTAIACLVTGNVLPWATLQAGGMLLVLYAALRPREVGGLGIRWGYVLLAYGIAKVAELQDAPIFEWTGGHLSGHTLKHALAALAAIPAIGALVRGRANAPA